MASQRASAARLVLVTAGSEREARRIARALVEERLAACVNIVARVRSIYRWRDAIEEAREYLLVIKTRAALYLRLERRVRELHSYEVPEILSLALDRGHQAYVKWLFDSTAVRRGARS
ncbi:MAG TPA: divalent-cation tolerance protein CutA [Candidatus Binataceae bacterium]|nr:divalent-cation tolerance protein CutA [Candidatus Binataceae bacterium]